MKKYIEEHKLLVIIGVLSLVFLVFIIIGFKNMYFSSDGDVYGNRLEGINKVKIKDEEINNAKKELTDTEKVSDVKVKLQGKIVYFTIKFKEEVSIDQAKEMATKTLTHFSDEEKSFYDFNYTLTQESKDEGNNFPTMGSKHPKVSTIVWINQNS